MRVLERTRRALPLLAVATLALVTGVLAGVVTAPPARADFASQCAAPDRTVGASDPSISVGAGETVLVASSYSGGIDALPAGGTLCVAPGATLTALYMNNAAGALVVAAGGSLVMPQVAVNAGFSLDVAGTASFAGLNVNGSADLHIAPQGSLTVASGFNPAAGTFVNEGTFTVQGSMNLNGPVSFTNSGTLAVAAATTVNGPLANNGLATFSGGLTINGSGVLHNSCVVEAAGALANNAAGSTNTGLVRVTGNLTNNGTWAQAPTGLTSAVGLTDDGAVSGFGAYAFTGTTSVQGSFAGDSPADPVRVQTVAPPGQIFDVQTGTVVNVVRTTVDVPTELPSCASGPQPPPADVEATKTGPATVLEGGTAAYTVSVRNDGPADAVGVVASDTLPAGFTLDPASTTGTLSGGVLSWNVGTVTAGQTVTLTFSGTVTAPAGSVLLDIVRSTATTPDPVPANNDGTSASARVTTDVVAVPPPNQPPVADDLTRDTQTGVLVDGRATASDPDAGQTLTFSVVSGPAHGSFLLFPGGGFFYVSANDFAGVDTVVFRVCDNASPVPACDTGTITLNVRPNAVPDMATTFQGTPVVIPVLENDTAGAPLDPAAVTPPSNGAVVLDPVTGTATYTPAPGFVGTDTFAYRICSPTEPTFCDTATVTVTVLPVNLPPTVEPQTLATTTGTPATGTLVMSDPNPGDTVTAFRGIPPRTGTAQVGTDGSLTYVPRAGFAGRDRFGVVVCDDGTPVLCATAIVTVEVRPVANPDTATTPEGTAVDVAVTANDLGLVDPPSLASGPSHGSVTFSGATARYLPAAGFSGTDTFEYTICATPAPDLCATTTVTVTVTAAPTPTPTPTPEPTTPSPGPTTPAPGPTPGGGGPLAGTGSTVGPVAAAALALLLGGGSAVLLSRRRRPSEDD